MGEISEEIVASLQRAVAANPQDTALRLHLADLLLGAGRAVEALGEVNAVLTADPGNAAGLTLLSRTAAALNPAGQTPAALPHAEVPNQDPAEPAATQSAETEPAATEPAVTQPAETEPAETEPAELEPVELEPAQTDPEEADPADPETGKAAAAADAAFDWTRAEAEVGTELPPPFVESELRIGASDTASVPPLEPAGPPVTLADVGGLEAVKHRLHESFLQPMRHADVAKAFGKSLRGGLLLYGPPGCGKTFLARAVAGELGASFINVTMTDVLDSYVGRTEQNLHEVFMEARRKSPAVLFLDEVDALGMRRSSLGGGSAWLRQMVNQLLIEMDSTAGTNDGLYVLAATNHPWDLDEALLRPGRLDRMVLVIPPDAAARDAILRYHLTNRPIAGIDIPAIVQRTDGFSGADLEHVCVTAAEKAMTDSISSGELQPINMAHMQMALGEITASTGAWLEQSRNVVRFANRDGRYNDLSDYLRSRKML